MRKSLLAITLGLAATSALAAGEHGGSHSSTPDAEIDRTIQVARSRPVTCGLNPRHSASPLERLCASR